MAAADQRPTQAVQETSNGPWVFLQHDGESAKELLPGELQGDTGGEKESARNAPEETERSADHEKFSRWCYSASVVVYNVLLDDKRVCILGGALCAHVVLPLVAALVPLLPQAEGEGLQFLLAALRRFTMAAICVAAFSCATRFVSLAATKTSVVKNPDEVWAPLFGLLLTNVWILLAAWFAFIHEVCAVGVWDCRKLRRQGIESQAVAVVVENLAFYGLNFVAIFLVGTMCTDVVATFRAAWPHCRAKVEAWKLAHRRRRERWHRAAEFGLLEHLFAALTVFVLYTVASSDRRHPTLR